MASDVQSVAPLTGMAPTGMAPMAAAMAGEGMPAVILNIVKTCFAKFVTWSGRAARPEFWYLLAFIPLLGIIGLIVFWCQPGTPGSNRYGEPPQDPSRMG